MIISKDKLKFDEQEGYWIRSYFPEFIRSNILRCPYSTTNFPGIKGYFYNVNCSQQCPLFQYTPSIKNHCGEVTINCSKEQLVFRVEE